MPTLEWTNKRSSPTNAVVAYAASNGLRYELHREAERQFCAGVFRIGRPGKILSNGFNRIGDAKHWCQNHEDARAAAAGQDTTPAKSRPAAGNQAGPRARKKLKVRGISARLDNVG